MALQLESIAMPLDFTKHFSFVPHEFKLKMNTWYSWRVIVRLLNGRVTLDKGWATFVVVHRIKIGCMVIFKLLSPDMLKVIVFNDGGMEVVTICGKHHEAFAVDP
ncbi:Speckle-type POZ protein [Hordeum vulgare]|nr:Speckle-type POZ protein [Hordeum vulgare]